MLITMLFSLPCCLPESSQASNAEETDNAPNEHAGGWQNDAVPLPGHFDA